MGFAIGDRVVKNPATWTASEFDSWGAGVGVGEVVGPPWSHEGGPAHVDVRWPAGRCTQRCDELLPDRPGEEPR